MKLMMLMYKHKTRISSKLRWLKKASHYFHVPALIEFASLYEKGGCGVEPDLDMAIKYMKYATERCSDNCRKITLKKLQRLQRIRQDKCSSIQHVYSPNQTIDEQLFFIEGDKRAALQQKPKSRKKKKKKKSRALQATTNNRIIEKVVTEKPMDEECVCKILIPILKIMAQQQPENPALFLFEAITGQSSTLVMDKFEHKYSYDIEDYMNILMLAEDETQATWLLENCTSLMVNLVRELLIEIEEEGGGLDESHLRNYAAHYLSSSLYENAFSFS